MKRRTERVVLELERENKRLKKQVSRFETVERASDATTGSTVSIASTKTTAPMLSVGECADFFHAALETHVAPYVLAPNVAEGSTKMRLVLDTTYAAFCVLVCVEGVGTEAHQCALFAMLVWIAEAALAAFFLAPVLRDEHEGHSRAFWELMKNTAFSPTRRASPQDQAHALQRAARSAWRESEATEFDCQGYRKRMFAEAKRVVDASVSVPLVLKAGCVGASAQFSPHQPHPLPPQHTPRGNQRR